MYKEIIKQHVSYFLILSIGVCAWIIQYERLCNPDVSWFIEASSRMLAGGTYTQNFFENNPPWILYFNIPAVLFQKLSAINPISAMRIYIFSLIFISLAICNYFLQRIFTRKDAILANLFLISLGITFFILPLYEFGQREHLLYILAMPYFLMTALRLQNIKINTMLAVMVGLLAGSVFILKPYFLATLFFIEIYYALCKKNIFSYLKPEIFTIFTLLIVYLVLILARHFDYLTFVLPHVIHWVYLGTTTSWISLANSVWVELSLFAILFYFATYSLNRYKSLSAILAIALCGFLFSFFAQHTSYAYRILPAAALSQVFFVLLLGMYTTTSKKKLYVYFLVTLILLSFIAIYGYFPLVSSCIIAQPLAFFCGISVLFFTYVFLLRSFGLSPSINYLKTVALPLLIGSLFFIAATTLFDVNKFTGISTCIIFILCFCLTIPGSFKERLIHLLIICLATLIFSAPFFNILVNLIYTKDLKHDYDSLISYLNSNASHQSIFVFSTTLTNSYPTILYTKNTTSAARFSDFWFLPGLMRQPYIPEYKNLSEQQAKDKNFLIEMCAEDIDLKKPKLLLFDDDPLKYSMNYKIRTNQIGHERSINIPYDFISDFSNNSKFKKALKNYHYLTTINKVNFYNINPFLSKLHLTYRHIPTDNEVLLYNQIYLYINQNENLEIAIKTTFATVARFKISTIEGLPPQQIADIKKILSTPGAELNKQNYQALLTWLGKQQLSQLVYKFKVYERNKA